MANLSRFPLPLDAAFLRKLARGSSNPDLIRRLSDAGHDERASETRPLGAADTAPEELDRLIDLAA